MASTYPSTMALTIAGETRTVTVRHDGFVDRLVTVDEVGVVRLPTGGKHWPSAVFFNPDGNGGWAAQTVGYRRLRRDDYQLVGWFTPQLDDVSLHVGEDAWWRRQWEQEFTG